MAFSITTSLTLPLIYSGKELKNLRNLFPPYHYVCASTLQSGICKIRQRISTHIALYTLDVVLYTFLSLQWCCFAEAVLLENLALVCMA